MKTELEKAAYAMQAAYRETGGLGTCLLAVSRAFPAIPVDVLEGMWRAIDAYADMENTTPESSTE